MLGLNIRILNGVVLLASNADVNQTSIQEQRVTPWMDYESLEQFLDPTDPKKTIEGYPAPKRAMFICSL